MSDIQQAAHQFLIVDSQVSGLASTRIYPDVLPVSNTKIDAADFPAIVMSVITGRSEQHLGGASGLKTERLQVNCYALTRREANQLAEAVRVATQGYRGEMDTVFVSGATLETTFDDAFQPIDGSDQYLYVRILDFEIAHEEATTTT